MNRWPSVLPTEPDLTWHLSDMCNFYYELSIQRSGFEWHYLYSDASPFFPCDSVLVILRFSWFMTALYLLFLFFLILWGIFTSGWLWRVSSYSNLPPKCWRLEHFHWNRHTHMQLGLRIDHPWNYQVDSVGGWAFQLYKFPCTGGDVIGPFIGSLRCQCRCIASSLQGFP